MRALIACGLATALTLGGCGPAGVTVAEDWTGYSFYALASVGGQRVVVGVDPAGRRTANLVVVPSRADDDTVLAPSMARAGAETTLLAVPRTGGRAGQLYMVDRASASLSVVGTLENGRSLIAAGSVLASVADGRPTRVINPETWLVTREVAAVEASGYAAGSRQRPVLCVASPTPAGLTGQAIELTSGAVLASVEVPGTPVLGLACSAQRPLVLVGAPGPAGVTADLGAGTLTVAGGSLAEALVTDAAIAVAVSDNVDTTLIELSADGTREVRRSVVDGFPAVAGLYAVEGGYLLLGHGEAAYVGASVDVFPLPGPLISAPA